MIPTPDEIERNREQLRQRLAEAPDMRTEQANSHVEAGEIAERLTGWKSTVESERYHSFLAGWDAAMNVSSKSMFEELQVVRSKHDDLVCERFKAELALPKLVAAARKAEAVMSKHIHPQPDKTGTPWEALKELREALKELEG